MKINVPKVLRKILLADYAAEYGEAAIQVWINPPKEMLQQRVDLIKELTEKQKQLQEEYAKKKKAPPSLNEQDWYEAWKRRWLAWFAQLWSQAPDPETHWSVEDILQAEAADPKLMRFALEQTIGLVDDLKKA